MGLPPPLPEEGRCAPPRASTITDEDCTPGIGYYSSQLKNDAMGCIDKVDRAFAGNKPAFHD